MCAARTGAATHGCSNGKARLSWTTSYHTYGAHRHRRLSRLSSRRALTRRGLDSVGSEARARRRRPCSAGRRRRTCLSLHPSDPDLSRRAASQPTPIAPPSPSSTRRAAVVGAVSRRCRDSATLDTSLRSRERPRGRDVEVRGPPTFGCRVLQMRALRSPAGFATNSEARLLRTTLRQDAGGRPGRAATSARAPTGGRLPVTSQHTHQKGPTSTSPAPPPPQMLRTPFSASTTPVPACDDPALRVPAAARRSGHVSSAEVAEATTAALCGEGMPARRVQNDGRRT